jgi:hypothetical protein
MIRRSYSSRDDSSSRSRASSVSPPTRSSAEPRSIVLKVREVGQELLESLENAVRVCLGLTDASLGAAGSFDNSLREKLAIHPSLLQLLVNLPSSPPYLRGRLNLLRTGSKIVSLIFKADIHEVAAGSMSSAGGIFRRFRRFGRKVRASRARGAGGSFGGGIASRGASVDSSAKLKCLPPVFTSLGLNLLPVRAEVDAGSSRGSVPSCRSSVTSISSQFNSLPIFRRL